MNQKIFAMFATILMLGTLAMPVVAAQDVDDCEIHEFHSEIQYMGEEEKDGAIEELLYDLKDAVASYNEAVIGGCPEDAEDYARDIIDILNELEAPGLQIVISTKETALPLEITVVETDNPAPVVIIIGGIAVTTVMVYASARWVLGLCHQCSLLAAGLLAPTGVFSPLLAATKLQAAGLVALGFISRSSGLHMIRTLVDSCPFSNPRCAI